ncbi:hypothetical protein YYE_03736 [Plasmodium vinckei vinckei]|uniref:PIR protein CIR protein n=1 Tax=Plasmodium vinckei vinckei TaxID=54757 RepID=A0A081ID78_PLAVN|nr:hypothetical protein YYE_03736 [Plasmodium vinckei vinckei]
MDPNEVCESFIVADKHYNDGNVDMDEITRHSGFYEHCPNRKCRSTTQGFVALSTYLFLKLNAHKNNENGEYFLMWLSDKLFKIHLQKKYTKKNPITLDMAYKMYLEKDMGNFNYWNLLGNIRGLKNANLRHMKEFYKLLNHICKTIIYFKYNYTESTDLLQNSTNSSNQYMLLYQNVSKCDSYLHLLDNLKKTYNTFRNTIKKAYPSLAIYLQTLTTIENADSYFAENFKKFDFSDSKCKSRYDYKILDKFTQAKTQGKQKDNGTNGDSNNQSSQPQFSGDQTPSPPVETGDSPSMPDNGADTSGGINISVGDTQNKTNPKGNEQKDSGGDTRNQKSHPSNPINPNDGTPISGTNQGGEPGDGSVDKSNGVQINQGGSESSNDGTRNTDNKSPNAGGAQRDQGNSVDGSGSGSKGPDSGPGTSETQSTSWSFFGIGSYISTIASKGKEQLNNAVTSLETIKKKVTETTNTLQNLYSRSVSNIQAAYDKSRSLLYDAIDNINSYSKQIGNIFIQNDDHSGSDDTKNGLPKSNDPSQTSIDPPAIIPPDLSNPQNQAPTPPQYHPPPTSPQLPSLPNSSPILPLDPSKDPLQQKQSPPQSQYITQQPTQTNSSNQQTVVQLLKLPNSDPISRAPWNIIPSTWNGSGNCKSKINLMSATLLCCTSEQCSLTGVSVTFILIPIILLIVHKYLSSVWRKEIKRKKNMKKVINSIGGKRPMKIIIKSVDMKKMETSVINLVRRKKKSLLNIYKLMQADPKARFHRIINLINLYLKSNSKNAK